MPLDLPEPDDARLSNSPLELVVCQIRHEEHPDVSKPETAAELHDALGGAEGPYARVDAIEAQGLSVTAGPAAPPNIETTVTRGWKLTSADGTWVVTLHPDHIALETTAYTTWAGDFQDRLDTLIDLAADKIKPVFSQRVGLRYVDRIKELNLKKPRDWQPFITPELLGPALHPAFGDAVVAAQQQVAIDLGDGVTCTLRQGPLPAENGKVDYLLDYDIARQAGHRFDAAALKEEAARFNRYAHQLFQASIEDALREELK